MGRRLPEGVQVRVVEESADTIYLVLPSASALVDQGGELSDQELEAVAGGVGGKNTDNDPTCGRACNTEYVLVYRVDPNTISAQPFREYYRSEVRGILGVETGGVTARPTPSLDLVQGVSRTAGPFALLISYLSAIP